MKIFAIATALSAAPLHAASPPVLPVATFKDLQAVVGALGHVVEAQDPSKQSLRAAAPDGMRYVLTGTACDIEGVPGCRGVVMQALFEPAEAVTMERLAAANLHQVAVSTRFDPGTNVISVTRYVVLDGGVTMANLAQNIEVLLALAPEVVSELFGIEPVANEPG